MDSAYTSAKWRDGEPNDFQTIQKFNLFVQKLLKVWNQKLLEKLNKVWT